MIFKKIAPLLLLIASSIAVAAPGEPSCGTLVGAANTAAPDGGFQLRDGESVDFIANGKTVHGNLLIFVDRGIYRAYWQPLKSAEKYVLADAGTNSIRLISTPPQGERASGGIPGTTLPPQHVLSCPTL